MSSRPGATGRTPRSMKGKGPTNGAQFVTVFG